MTYQLTDHLRITFGEVCRSTVFAAYKGVRSPLGDRDSWGSRASREAIVFYQGLHEMLVHNVPMRISSVPTVVGSTIAIVMSDPTFVALTAAQRKVISDTIKPIVSLDLTTAINSYAIRAAL